MPATDRAYVSHIYICHERMPATDRDYVPYLYVCHEWMSVIMPLGHLETGKRCSKSTSCMSGKCFRCPGAAFNICVEGRYHHNINTPTARPTMNFFAPNGVHHPMNEIYSENLYLLCNDVYDWLRVNGLLTLKLN